MTASDVPLRAIVHSRNLSQHWCEASDEVGTPSQDRGRMLLVFLRQHDRLSGELKDDNKPKLV